MTISQLLLAAYGSATVVVFLRWLRLFYRDRATPKTDSMSWLVLLVGALFWPISLPLSWRELSDRQRRAQQLAAWQVQRNERKDGDNSTSVLPTESDRPPSPR